MVHTTDRKTGSEAKSGPEVIRAYLARLPNRPGVYRMVARDGEVLYVGKAKSLKKRVQSYTRGPGHSNRIARMIANTVEMEFVTTNTETEALLLEANLIKRLKPRYNVVLRDDKSFPYILLARDHEVAQIVKHRGARSRKGDYFGPFASAGAVNRTINALERAFLLRSCSDSIYENRSRPCLLYQIKRCSAPCTGEIAKADYDALVDEAFRFLSGRSHKVKDTLLAQMKTASADLDFERAAIYRDRIAALSQIQSRQGINPNTVREADVFALAHEGGQACIQVFFFRAGQNWGNRAYFPRADKSHEPEEILEAFLAQFYDSRPCPRLLLTSHEIKGRALLSEALSLKTGFKVRVTMPQRGEKRDLVDHAAANAREALGRRMAETASQTALLEGVAGHFALESAPERIEVYDNSHIQGSHPVGAMVVAGPEGLEKGQYRKFNIKEESAPGDDYAMMREMLKRRFQRLLREEGAENGAAAPRPDLVLIDGGAGQLSAAREVMTELGLADIPMAGIAKGPDRDAGRERFFMTGRESFILPERDPVLYYVQRLRDEAHRFAIGSHRARRRKAIGTNPLDEISGIGQHRKRALLHHFGSARAVSRAGLADLEAVDGISQATAKAVYDHFHDDNTR